MRQFQMGRQPHAVHGVAIGFVRVALAAGPQETSDARGRPIVAVCLPRRAVPVSESLRTHFFCFGPKGVVWVAMGWRQRRWRGMRMAVLEAVGWLVFAQGSFWSRVGGFCIARLLIHRFLPPPRFPYCAHPKKKEECSCENGGARPWSGA